jgi:hypothetical protein
MNIDQSSMQKRTWKTGSKIAKPPHSLWFASEAFFEYPYWHKQDGLDSIDVKGKAKVQTKKGRSSSNSPDFRVFELSGLFFRGSAFPRTSPPPCFANVPPE